MAHVYTEELAREIRAVLTADVKTTLQNVPQPHTAAQISDAVAASAATLGASFQVHIRRDLDRPQRFNVTVLILAGR